jgi:hypothetical protein
MKTKKEQLAGTYLKYNNRITKNVFDKVIEKLEQIGFSYSLKREKSMNNSGFNGSYEQFSDSNGCFFGGYLVISPDRYPDEYYVDNHSSSVTKEVTVEDILGIQLIPGEVYYTSGKYGAAPIIFRYDEINGYLAVYGNHIIKTYYYSNDLFHKDHINLFSYFFKIDKSLEVRLATQEEKRWLETCEKAGKFVPKETISELKGFEIGKWYTHKNKSMLVCYKGEGEGYGFLNNMWGSYWCITKREDWKLATEEEVRDALLEFAKKNYPKGTEYVSISTSLTYTSQGGFKYDDGQIMEGRPDNPRVCSIYKYGKWAKIISKPKEKAIDLSCRCVTGTYKVEEPSLGEFKRLWKEDMEARSYRPFILPKKATTISLGTAQLSKKEPLKPSDFIKLPEKKEEKKKARIKITINKY